MRFLRDPNKKLKDADSEEDTDSEENVDVDVDKFLKFIEKGIE